MYVAQKDEAIWIKNNINREVNVSFRKKTNIIFHQMTYPFFK